MVTKSQTQKPAAWVIDPAHTSIEFAAKHMVITTVKGRFTRFDVDVDFDEAKPERSRVEVRIDAASIETKEPKRDAHLRSPDFLDAERFPEITFKSRRIEARGDNRYNLVGDLTIRGATRPVVLDTTFTGVMKDPMGNVHAGFSAETTLQRKDWGLTWNMALEAGALLVGESVKVSVEAEIIKRKQ